MTTATPTPETTMSKTEKPWMVVSAETQISVQYFATKKEAEALAREMSEYHQKPYVAVRR